MRTQFCPVIALVALSQNTLAYDAHEWGTFTSLMGSDGKTQHGMYHEDEVLPDFVHGFGEIQRTEPQPVRPRPPCRGKGCFNDEFFDNNVVTQKMETPVIYFYSDRDQKVEVNVRFPRGIFTDSFPAPVRSWPTSRNIHNLFNGSATFNVELRPSLGLNPPAVPAGNIYGHARNVESTPLISGNEVEKFIFYRGLGQFEPRGISITSQQGNLSYHVAKSVHVQAGFLVDVDALGNTRFINVGAIGTRLSAEELAAFRTHGVDESEQARLEIVTALQVAGLRADEAHAMLDTWQHGYLKVPGLRFLYILSRAEADAILPLTFSPAPEHLERVFVGRIEILLDTDEDQILQTILAQRENFSIATLGRFAEPILRRVSQRYTGGDAAVRNLFERFIKQASLAALP